MWNWISKLEELRQLGKPVVTVTVAHCTGSTPREAGAKMVVQSDGTFFGTIGGGRLEELAITDARKCLEDVLAKPLTEPMAKSIRYPLGAKTGQCCGGIVDLLFEVLNVEPRLFLFGAGHVGQAVCRTLAGTDFKVHLVDERPEWIRSPKIPADVIRHESGWEDFVDEAEWDSNRTFVAIMTHRHDTDQKILKDILGKKKQARYVGLIGSDSKWARFRQRLDGSGISAEEISRVRCPIGIDIGGKAPQEVAISIGAELLKIRYGR